MKKSKLKIEDFLDNILNQKQTINVSGGTRGTGVIPPPVDPVDPPPSSGSGDPIGPPPPPPPPIIILG